MDVQGVGVKLLKAQVREQRGHQHHHRIWLWRPPVGPTLPPAREALRVSDWAAARGSSPLVLGPPADIFGGAISVLERTRSFLTFVVNVYRSTSSLVASSSQLGDHEDTGKQHNTDSKQTDGVFHSIICRLCKCRLDGWLCGGSSGGGWHSLSCPHPAYTVLYVCWGQIDAEPAQDGRRKQRPQNDLDNHGNGGHQLTTTQIKAIPVLGS